MPTVKTTLLMLITLIGHFLPEKYEPFEPIRYAENLTLDGYDIRSTHKMPDGSYVLIGQPDSFVSTNQGLRLFHLVEKNSRYVVNYVSAGVGESFMYRPTFYRKDGRTIIVCEMGTEYSWGADAFLMENGEMQKLGTMDVAACINHEEQQESPIPILRIEELEEEVIRFSFINSRYYAGMRVSGISLFLHPGHAKEEDIGVSSIHYEWDGSWRIRRN